MKNIYRKLPQIMMRNIYQKTKIFRTSKKAINLEKHYRSLLQDHGYNPDSQINKKNISSITKGLYQWVEEVKQTENNLEFEFDRESFNKHIDNIDSPHVNVETVGNLLLKAYKKIAKREEGKKFPTVIFRTFPTDDINSHALHYPEGFIVIVERGLNSFFHVFISLLLRSKTVQSIIFKKPICDVLEDSIVIEEIASLFTHYIKNRKIPEKLLFNSMFTPNDGLIFHYSSKLYIELLSFILAHELAHIYLDHHGSSLKKMKDGAIISQLQEFMADDLAFITLFSKDRLITTKGHKWKDLDAISTQFANHLSLSFSGILIFFTANIWLEKIKSEITQGDKTQKEGNVFDTHPSHKERLSGIKEKMIQHFPSIHRVPRFSICLEYFEKEVIKKVLEAIA